MGNLARLYTNEIVTRHGVHVSIISDRGGKIYFAALVDIAEGIENTAKTCVRLIILKWTDKDTHLPLTEYSIIIVIIRVFDVLYLKRCMEGSYWTDANLHVHLKEIKVDKTLRFVEEPIEIIDLEVKSLKRSRIPIVKSMGTRSEIFLTLSDALQEHLVVANPKTAKDVLDHIEKKFLNNKHTKTIALKSELQMLQLGDLTVDAYFHKIESITTILTNLGSLMRNDDVVTYTYE
ncbi:hypothetical protein Tco_0066903 [Tanacetum coccineum]